jgi:hypothetical protein
MELTEYTKGQEVIFHFLALSVLFLSVLFLHLHDGRGGAVGVTQFRLSDHLLGQGFESQACGRIRV